MRHSIIVTILVLLLCTFETKGQVYQAMPQAGYGPVKRMLIDSVLTIPIGISALRNITGGRDTAQIRYQKSDSSVYVYTGSTWVKLGTGGSGGGSADSTVFFTVYRADTMRANIYGSIPQPDTIYARYPVRISNDTIYLQQAFVDSVYNVSSGDATRLVTTVYNNTGSTITKGSVVYISGRHSSNLPTIALAEANNEANSYKTFALVETDITTSNSGRVIQAGKIENLNLPTSTYTDGDILYLSPTVPGGYTTTKPQAPNHIVKLGSVTRAHPTLGSIEIKIENGWELSELSDVQIAAVPADSALLQFSRVDSLWKDRTITQAIGPYLDAKANTTGATFTGAVGIGSAPVSTAQLDVSSTSRGLLIPRMTTSQRNAISTPASQLIVANTTEKTVDMYNGTTWNTIGGGYSNDLQALQLMGAKIKTVPIGQPVLPTTASSMVSSRSYFSAIYLSKEATITGAIWFQNTQGVYVGTGGGYNGIGLYRDSLGTVLLVDSTTRDTTIWKAASNTWNQKAFAGGSRTLQPGVYYLMALVNTATTSFPAGQTAPVIGNWTLPAGNSGTFTLLSNNRKIMGGVLSGVTALPTSQAMTDWNSLSNFYYSLFLY